MQPRCKNGLCIEYHVTWSHDIHDDYDIIIILICPQRTMGGVVLMEEGSWPLIEGTDIRKKSAQLESSMTNSNLEETCRHSWRNRTEVSGKKWAGNRFSGVLFGGHASIYLKEGHAQGNRTRENTVGSLKRIWGPTWLLAPSFTAVSPQTCPLPAFWLLVTRL